MESSAILPRGALLPVPVCLGMTFATEVAVAQCPDRGAVVDDEVSNTQGKPYQAKEVRTVVTYGSDPGRSSSGVNALPRIVDIPSKAKMLLVTRRTTTRSGFSDRSRFSERVAVQ